MKIKYLGQYFDYLEEKISIHYHLWMANHSSFAPTIESHTKIVEDKCEQFLDFTFLGNKRLEKLLNLQQKASLISDSLYN